LLSLFVSQFSKNFFFLYVSLFFPFISIEMNFSAKNQTRKHLLSNYFFPFFVTSRAC
jgi:hypothetical protein